MSHKVYCNCIAGMYTGSNALWWIPYSSGFISVYIRMEYCEKKNVHCERLPCYGLIIFLFIFLAFRTLLFILKCNIDIIILPTPHNPKYKWNFET